jgi:hypothetical protein
MINELERMWMEAEVPVFASRYNEGEFHHYLKDCTKTPWNASTISARLMRHPLSEDFIGFYTANVFRCLPGDRLSRLLFLWFYSVPPGKFWIVP